MTALEALQTAFQSPGLRVRPITAIDYWYSFVDGCFRQFSFYVSNKGLVKEDAVKVNVSELLKADGSPVEWEVITEEEL